MNQNFRFSATCPTRELLAARSRVEDPKPALVHSRLALISTMINYIDGQTLFVLATFLQVRYHSLRLGCGGKIRIQLDSVPCPLKQALNHCKQVSRVDRFREYREMVAF
jgi:hypothetical protein